VKKKSESFFSGKQKKLAERKKIGIAVVALCIIFSIFWGNASDESKRNISAASSDLQKQETADVVTGVSIADIPAYSGSAYVTVNGNVPYFTDDEMSSVSYEYYSPLDSLDRCGVCIASVGQDIMPTEERGKIGDVKPTGWHTVKYAGIVDGNYLYNRCHLIAYQLTGENSNTKNLITGTRYMNVEGMLPFENMVADYVRESGNHVMYRVTPMFDGDNLLATGVLMEAKSVEDGGAGILFNVFCYNVQPGISIDYASGDSAADSTVVADTESGAYAVNANNGKIHIVGACAATEGGSNAMKKPVYFNTYEEAQAYSEVIAPSQSKRNCGNCW
jgi:DNA-entry nuclease